VIDAPTQGEIGETLVHDAPPEIPLPQNVYSEENFSPTDFSINPVTGTIIASGFVASYKFAIRRSTDGGSTWSSVTLPDSPVLYTQSSVGIFANNQWVLLNLSRVGGSNILRSIDDGVTWSVQLINNRAFSDLVYGNGRFIAIAKDTGGGDIFAYWSLDGITWNEVNLGLTTLGQIAPCRMAHDGANTIVALGYRVIMPNNDVPVIAVSTNNGDSWTDISSSLIASAGYSVPLRPFSIWRANGKWYVYCWKTTNAEIWATTDLATWTKVQTNYKSIYDSYPFNPGSGPKFDVTELYGIPVMYSQVTPSTTRGFGSVGDTSSTYLSADFPFLHTQVVRAERIIKYNGLEYHFSGGQGPATTGFIKKIPILQTSIFKNCVNIKLNTDRTAALAENVNVSNVTSEQATLDSFLSLPGCSIIRSKAVSTARGVVHYGGKLITRRCLVKATTLAMQVNGTAASTGDIELSQNTIIGGVQLNNTGGSDKEFIQDNIIEGDFIAATPVTVRSNIRGAVVNASGLSKISSINPLFVNTTDYELSRVALGQSIDSQLVKRSSVYSYTYNAQTFPDDFGAYRVFIALLQISYKRAFLLPKFSANALNEDVENSAALLKSINGIPDVSNRPEARIELLSWTSKSVDDQVREFISFLERERNTQVELYIDGDETLLDDIIVNGAHSSGSFEINIQPKDVVVGTVFKLFGKLRYVVQRYPRSGQATKLVLDDVLSGGLSDGQHIQIAQTQGAGVFVFVPEQRRQNVRVFSRRRDTYTGMRYTFARKAL
jgi:hypothetical protein